MKNIIDIMDIETSIVSLYEASILDIEDTLETGEDQVNRMLIQKWLEENSNCVEKPIGQDPIRNDNKIVASVVRPYEAYSKSMMELPAPEYIKFADVEDMIVNRAIDFKKFPETDYINFLFLDIWDRTGDQIPIKLTDLPAKTVKSIYIKTYSTLVDGFPKKTAVENVIYDFMRIVEWEYDGRWLVKNPAKFFKGLKCKYLVIPDLFYTTECTLLTSYRSAGAWSEDRTVMAGSPEAEILDKIFEVGGFKELYTYSPYCPYSVGTGKYRRVKKFTQGDTYGYSISKRQKYIKL